MMLGVFIWSVLHYFANGERAAVWLFGKKVLLEAKVAVSPGVGFGQYGDKFVRFALIENEHRTRQATRSLRALMRDEAPIRADSG